MPTSRRHGHIAVQVGSITFMLVRSPENEKKKKKHLTSGAMNSGVPQKVLVV